MTAEVPAEHAARDARFWRRVKALTAGLLALWLLVTLVGPWFARDLQHLRFLGFPLSFWVASQGALIIYVLIILGYALAMERLDDSYRGEREAGAAAPPPRAR
jgi:putative solute:sodium symporter small subunit